MAERRKRQPGGGANSKTSPDAIARWKRDQECVKLRLAGIKWQTIADRLYNGDPGNAYRACNQMMKNYPREDIEELRDMEADRLDAMQAAIWAKVLKGDNWSIDRALKISDQRARLLGLNRPVPPAPDPDDGRAERQSALADLFALMVERANQ